jgi:hypothetical protein
VTTEFRTHINGQEVSADTPLPVEVQGAEVSLTAEVNNEALATAIATATAEALDGLEINLSAATITALAAAIADAISGS